MLKAAFKVYFTLTLLCMALAYCTPSHAKDFKREYACLAKNVYFEAGREPFKGKVAVAQVTLNRVNHPGFPRSVCGVVKQKTGKVCQFSWHCENNRQINYKSVAWQESTRAAYKVLMGQGKVIGKQVLFFHATAINPMWQYQKVAIIGGHVFYKKAKS